MSKNKELIPELRFPEFEKEGEWEDKKLGEVAENVMYGMNAASVNYDGENKYIRITDIDENTRLFSPNPLTSPDGQLEERDLVKVGDLLFARTGASVGKSYLHQSENGKVYFAGFLIRFTIINAIPYFVYAQTLTELYQKWVLKTSMRSGQPGINAEEYKSYPISFPKGEKGKAEQQKIAACLSSLDEVIAAHSQKLELLKDHKKGLMQNLFPQEGRKVPKLRFAEFLKKGEWEKQTFGEVLRFQTGFPFDSKGFNEDGKGIRLIRNRDLKSDDKIVFYNNSFDEKYLVYNNDILIGMDGDFTPCVWKKGKALLNQRVGRIIVNKKDQERFFYYILSIHLKTIEEKTARTTVKHLSHSDIEKINEPIPKPEEQQKIAACLSALDELIAAQTEKIEQLKLHKKGLMQGLFPKMND